MGFKIPSVGPVDFPEIDGKFVGYVVASAAVLYLINSGVKMVSANTSGVVKKVADTASKVTS